VPEPNQNEHSVLKDVL